MLVNLISILTEAQVTRLHIIVDLLVQLLQIMLIIGPNRDLNNVVALLLSDSHIDLEVLLHSLWWVGSSHCIIVLAVVLSTLVIVLNILTIIVVVILVVVVVIVTIVIAIVFDRETILIDAVIHLSLHAQVVHPLAVSIVIVSVVSTVQVFSACQRCLRQVRVVISI